MIKKRVFIAAVFMLISMVLMVAPTIRHHHHSRANMCMKPDYCNCNDSKAEHHHDHQDDFACHFNCVAKFVLLQPQSSVSVDELSDLLPVLILPYAIVPDNEWQSPIHTLIRQLKIPDSPNEYCAYTVCAAGRRAPPAIA